MYADESKLLVRRFYEEVVTTGDVDRLEEFISPAYVEVYQDIRYPVGLEGAREHILGVLRMYSGFTLTVNQQISDGEWVATCITMQGTYSGLWLNMKPTSEQVETTAVNIDRVVLSKH